MEQRFRTNPINQENILVKSFLGKNSFGGESLGFVQYQLFFLIPESRRVLFNLMVGHGAFVIPPSPTHCTYISPFFHPLAISKLAISQMDYARTGRKHTCQLKLHFLFPYTYVALL
jgi:hypothetical protein